MFKQTISTVKEVKGTKNIINKLEAVTTEQRMKFAKLTGRHDASFKIGKTADGI